MHKRILQLQVALLLIITTNLQAQLVKKRSSQSASDWYNLSIDKDSVYGASVNKAYAFLQHRQVKKKPLVAIISTGVDIEHDELKNAIWKNPKERPDQKDNDANGLVDDLHGWNFLGNTTGAMSEVFNHTAEREFFRLRDKYEAVFYTGKKFVKLDILSQKLTVLPPPKNIAEYYYYNLELSNSSEVAKQSKSYHFKKVLLYYLFNDFDSLLKKKFKEDSLIKPGDLKYLYETGLAEEDSLRLTSLNAITSIFGIATGFNPDMNYSLFKSSFTDTALAKQAQNKYHAALQQAANSRLQNEDDPARFQDSNYGNNLLCTHNSYAGTLAAGIIAADRNNDIGVKGIASVDIMPLRATPSSGDYYCKDIALAIRYAVNHKADIILLDAKSTEVNVEQALWLQEALQFAAQNNVLVITAAMDNAINLSGSKQFPNKYAGKLLKDKADRYATDANQHLFSFTKDKRAALENYITVAASDTAGNPLLESDFSKEEVDLFAPGVDVYSTFLGNTYKKATSSLMAAATVAGVAALVKSYYPHLTAVQLKTVLLESVSSRQGITVEKLVQIKGKYQPEKQYLSFEDLCLTGGIVNAYQAVKAAAKQ